MSDDLASYAWCRRTGGALTASQRRSLALASLRTYAGHAVGLARLATGRRPDRVAPLPTPPSDELLAAALHVARDQGPDVEGHGLRTWLFGSVLAAEDGVALEPDLFCVAAVVHDAGTARAVPGEDFTLRSADVAVEAFAHAGLPLDADAEVRLRDGVVAHATAGVTPERTAIGTYVQAGALLDLAGMRLADLPAEVVDEVFDRHPAGDVRRTITRVIAEEARALPDGRFALSHRLGLSLAVHTSPSLRGR